MRILIFSRSPWKKSNSFGNTYSNFFQGIRDFEIANIYLADGIPDKEEMVKCYYQISEREISKSIIPFWGDKKVGREFCSSDLSEENEQEISFDNKKVTFLKKKRWPIMYILREIVWKIGSYNTTELLGFVEKFAPDVIFMPLYYAAYVNDVALCVKKRYDVPIILEVSLDIYTMKQISVDPFFWINRLLIRESARKIVAQAELLYVISEKQKKDYQKIFGIQTEVLNKFQDDRRYGGKYKKNTGKLHFLYTGNIGDGRWKTLKKIADVLKEYEGEAELSIYTATPVTKVISRALNIKNVSCLYPPVNSDKVQELQKSADVLIHVESFSLKNRLNVRYSISTKIMDYISAGRCILAVCKKDVASYDYLKEIAIMASSKCELKKEIRRIINEREYIVNAARKCPESINSSVYQKKIFHDRICDVVKRYKRQKGINDD